MQTRPATVLLCLDAHHAIGLGHAVRVAAILAQLERPLRLVVAGEGAQLEVLFPGARRCPLPGPDAIGALLAEVAPGLVLVDRPGLGAGWWDALERAAPAIPLALVDDFGGSFPVDLVINGTVLEQYHQYRALRPGAAALLGAPFALVRPDFARQPWTDPDQRSVQIVAGGGDAARDWALQLVSGTVDLRGWGQVGMIVGAAFPDLPALAAGCARCGVRLESGVPAARMAQALSQAALALVTGGMVVYEAMAAGVPALVFPLLEDMVAEARWCAGQGAIAELGREGGTDPALLARSVGALLGDRAGRRALSLRARALVDGQGMARAAQAIGALLERAP